MTENSLGTTFSGHLWESCDDDKMSHLSCAPYSFQDQNLIILWFSLEKEKVLLYLQVLSFATENCLGEAYSLYFVSWSEKFPTPALPLTSLGPEY